MAVAAAIVSATASAVVILVMVPIVPVVARFDPISVLTVVGTTGDDYSVGALLFVAFRYCSLLTTRKKLPCISISQG